MIRIPSHPYDPRENRDVTVDPSEGRVVFSLEVEPDDLYRRGLARSVGAEVDEILKSLDEDPGARLVGDLSDEEVTAVLDEVRFLRARFTELVDSVDLYLDAGRARAIAAGLTYAALEIEEGRA